MTHMTLTWAVELKDTELGPWLLGRFGATHDIPDGLSGYRLATWNTRKLARAFCASKRADAKGHTWMMKQWRDAKPVRVRVTVEKAGQQGVKVGYLMGSIT